MPKATTERLFGYGFQVAHERAVLPVPEVTADGGEPTISMQEMDIVVLAFVDPSTGHRIELPLSEDGRQKIVQLLTGGIEIATRIPH